MFDTKIFIRNVILYRSSNGVAGHKYQNDALLTQFRSVGKRPLSYHLMSVIVSWMLQLIWKHVMLMFF